MDIRDLKPAEVWHFFYEMTQVPRPSKKEGKIIEFLEKFANDHHLEYKKDKVGNIVIKKPATKGYEDRPIIVLQSHVDMVCEKNSDVQHDFDNDPIKTIIDGDWVRADGTTLGADNGIGCAAELAILASDTLDHGPIECLFTVDEETGMTGAMNLEPGFIEGRTLLNLDSEDEGELFIGCAGGINTFGKYTYKPIVAPADFHYAQIKVFGLKGGHSGGDIHVGLANANKLILRILTELDERMDWKLASINGGNLHNAIPREANAIVGIPNDKKEELRVLVNEFAAKFRDELKRVDPNVEVSLESVDAPKEVIDDMTKLNLIRSLYACPHGVYGMSHDIEGLVETSNNLASIKMKPEHTILVETSQRSSAESLREDIKNMVASALRLGGAEVESCDPYPGWKPNPDSAILKVANESYKRLFNKEPKVKAIHAGLECGLFLEIYPYLDMVSFGPTLRDVHSPVEKIEIKTVQMWWDHLVDLLKHIPAQK